MAEPLEASVPDHETLNCVDVVAGRQGRDGARQARAGVDGIEDLRRVQRRLGVENVTVAWALMTVPVGSDWFAMIV